MYHESLITYQTMTIAHQSDLVQQRKTKKNPMNTICYKISVSQRKVLHDWFETIADEYEIGSCWQISAFNRLDAFLSIHPIQLFDLQKFASICAHISIQSETSTYLCFAEWRPLCGEAYLETELSSAMQRYIDIVSTPGFDPRKGSTFIRELGKGNSIVREVRFTQDATNTCYAVKSYTHPKTQETPLEFFREWNAHQLVSKHPNASSCVGAWITTKESYMIFDKYDTTMEHMVMKQSQAHTTFSMHQIKQWISQLLDVVGFAHSHDLAHRDIKPQNILFHKDQLILCDWDSSCSSDQKGLYQTNPICTVPYRSPEVLCGNPAQLYDGFKLDMWSIGCILLYLINMKSWFNKNTEKHVLEAIIFWRGNSAKYFNHTQEDFVAEQKWPLSVRSRLGCDGIDFLNALLHLDPSKRLDTTQARKHQFMINS